jgi:hypothetical protein
MPRGRMHVLPSIRHAILVIATIQLFRPYLEIRRARQAAVAAAATKEAHALEKDDVYFQGDVGQTTSRTDWPDMLARIGSC